LDTKYFIILLVYIDIINSVQGIQNLNEFFESFSMNFGMFAQNYVKYFSLRKLALALFLVITYTSLLIILITSVILRCIDV